MLAGAVVYWNGGFDWFVLGRLRSWRIFHGFRTARLGDYALFVGLRTVFVAGYVMSHWLCMPFFHMHAPLRELFLYVPVLTFVATIPLTNVAGLGTVQLLMRVFFAGYVPAGVAAEAHVDAYSTVTILLFVLCRIGIGYLSMGTVARDFAEAARRSASPPAAGERQGP